MLGERVRSLSNKKKKRNPLSPATVARSAGRSPPVIPMVTIPRATSDASDLQESTIHSQSVLLSESEFKHAPSTFLGMQDENKFDLMNVTVVIYGLSGLMCQKEPLDLKKSKFGMKRSSSSVTSPVNKNIDGKSTASTADLSAAEEENFISNPNAPTTAVVSFRKNVVGSQQTMETFIPSLPLAAPSDIFGMSSRYAASWPSEQSTLVKDENAMERSSLHLIRCMKQETYVPGKLRTNAAPSNYVHEKIELRINLSRGTELVPLGTASVVISGDEEGEIQMTIPAKPYEHKESKKASKSSKTKANARKNKRGYFSSDPTRRFYLDENATVRIGLQVIPQEALEIAEQREKHNEELREMLALQVNDENQMGGNTEYPSTENFDMSQLKNSLPKGQPVQPKTPDAPTGLLQTLFCGAFLCAPSTQVQQPPISQQVIHPTGKRGMPNEIEVAEDLKYNFGVASLISSVSESSDDSDEDSVLDELLEMQMREFRMTAAGIPDGNQKVTY
jgi:hypothetical protein